MQDLFTLDVLTLLWNFCNFVYPALPVTFGGDTESRRSLLPGVYARGERKNSHTRGKCVTCHGLHNSEINHFCISPRMGCLEYTYIRSYAQPASHNRNETPLGINIAKDWPLKQAALGVVQVLRNARGGGWVYAQALRSVTRGWGGGYVSIT